jgi:plasmid replication initiation protein
MARPPRFAPIQSELFAFGGEYPFAGLKNLEPFMGTSWFSMEKRPRYIPIKHEYQKYWLEVKASEYGLATYWDQDLLLFAYSQLIGGIKAGEEVSRKIYFTGPDYFRFVGQQWSGSKDYKSVLQSLRRLQGTIVKTNIKAADGLDHAEQGVGWISEYRSYLSNNVTTFEMVLPEPFYKMVLNQKNWLTLDRSYFKIMGGLERFLYTWGRKSTGLNQDNIWEEKFASIYEKSGSLTPIRKFNHKLRGVINQQSLPGYILEEISDVKRGPTLILKRDINHPLLISTKKIRRKSLPIITKKQLSFSL